MFGLYLAFLIATAELAQDDAQQYKPMTSVPLFGSYCVTTTPSFFMIVMAREHMYINPALKIHPLGFIHLDSIDDTIRFKFLAETSDPSSLFLKDFVDHKKFKDLKKSSAVRTHGEIFQNENDRKEEIVDSKTREPINKNQKIADSNLPNGIKEMLKDMKSAESWWDFQKKEELFGGSFDVPPPGSNGLRGLRIRYTINNDDTITVYAEYQEY